MRPLDLAYLAAAPPLAAAATLRYARTGKPVAEWRAKATGRLDVPPKRGPRVWLHAVSVGEVIQCQPLVRELAARGVSDVVLSVSTASGLKLAREKYPDTAVVPFPFDFSWACRRAVRAIRPDAVVLTELEVWPNFVREVAAAGVPLIVANGRLSERSFRGYRRASRLLRGTFRRLTHVAAQNREYADRFAALGSPSVSVTGSVKFDGLQTDRNRPEVWRLRKALGLPPTDRVFVAGSTHAPEERAVLDAFRLISARHTDCRLLIVPRHPERFDEVASLIESDGRPPWRRTRPGTEPDAVRLLDSVGELSAAWALADVAFVGGTLDCGRGGQNMLEPAAYGVPTLFGPDTRNFADVATGLLRCRGAAVVADADNLAAAACRLLGRPDAAKRMGDAAAAYARSHRGAAGKTADIIVDAMRRQKFAAAA